MTANDDAAVDERIDQRWPLEENREKLLERLAGYVGRRSELEREIRRLRYEVTKLHEREMFVIDLLAVTS